MHIVDRRLNPNGKSLENRQRFLRRAKALIQGAVKKASQERDIKDVLEGGEVSVPIDGMEEPRFRREGGTRDMVLPGNKKFVEGDMLPRPSQGGGKGRGAGEGDSEDAFRFVLSRDEFVDLFLDDLELPDLAKRKLAEVESEGIRRAGRFPGLHGEAVDDGQLFMPQGHGIKRHAIPKMVVIGRDLGRGRKLDRMGNDGLPGQGRRR